MKLMGCCWYVTGIKIRLQKSNNHLCDNGYTKTQEEKIYDDLLVDVLENTRWYLDNLDNLRTFRVSWQDYRLKTTPTPLKLVNKKKGL
jgi:hypothetical protein